MKKCLLFFAVALLTISIAAAQTTKVYIVRHGEKSTENPSDPELSADGKERAEALAKFLKKKEVVAIFSTNYKRTKETAQILAEKNKITIETYSPKDVKALVAKINTSFKGKTVLLVGHSNTVLELTEAFGAERPLKVLTDDDYDNIFLVTIDGNNVKAMADKFGKAHHAGI